MAIAGRTRPWQRPLGAGAVQWIGAVMATFFVSS
jgi:hypothetical protein